VVPPADASRVSPARRCAFRVLRRVFDEGAWADRAFRAEAERAGLEPRERAFAQRLAYGTVQRRMTLDHVLGALSSRPPGGIEAPVRDALRLGLLQLLYLDGVPDHAAVSQTVELAGSERGRARGFANALMRRAAREARAIVAGIDASTPEGAALLHSHPEWIARMWWDALGASEALALMERDNEPAESSVRVNTLAASREKLETELSALGASPRADPLAPEALVLGAPWDVHGSEAFAAGRLMPQARSSMLVSRVLDPHPGERVLDMCAAPGGKTTHLAALMGEGSLTALELDRARCEALAENCRRMRCGWVSVRRQDARAPAPGAPFDRILLDAPCSDLGTLQSRPDARWRKQPEQVEELAALQRELLEAAAAQLGPGGVLVLSACTISPSENEQLVSAFLAEHPELSLGRSLKLLPHRDRTDGFFIARLERSGHH
jgi:16S rRNA (cytosine967-C5)-methyltransferase